MMIAEETALLLDRWQQLSKKFADLAGELPVDAAPVAGLRTTGDVARHVAFWNHYVADTLSGRPANDSANELPRDQYSTRESVLEALRVSSDAVVAALQAASANGATAQTVVPFLEHTAEHYGQLAVYARLQGIVPPASRG